LDEYLFLHGWDVPICGSISVLSAVFDD